MRHLNYNHLLYFWSVARSGSVAAAATQNFITPQTISGQLRQLEEALGQPLFHRTGRRLELTEFGHAVSDYCDDIFGRGAELASFVQSQSGAALVSLRAG
ncbi:MAG: LysR family transcriptional regulator, partial [Pseudomonadota bacterium]